MSYIELIGAIILVAIPVISFMDSDANYKVSEGCEKVRDFPYMSGLLLLVSAPTLIYITFLLYVNPGISLIAKLVLETFSVVIYLIVARYFVVDNLGYILDPSAGAISVPGGSRDANSFLDYLNPMFYLRFLRREVIKINSIRGISQRRYILNISTADGNRIAKFHSIAKCDRLNDLFSRAMKLPVVNQVQK